MSTWFVSEGTPAVVSVSPFLLACSDGEVASFRNPRGILLSSLSPLSCETQNLTRSRNVTERNPMSLDPSHPSWTETVRDRDRDRDRDTERQGQGGRREGRKQETGTSQRRDGGQRRPLDPACDERSDAFHAIILPWFLLLFVPSPGPSERSPERYEVGSRLTEDGIGFDSPFPERGDGSDRPVSSRVPSLGCSLLFFHAS